MDKRLEILLELGLVDRNALDRLDPRAEESTLDALLRSGSVAEGDYLRAIAAHSGFPLFDFADAPELGAGLLDPELMRTFQALPVRADGEVLVVAVADPFNRACLEDLPLLAGKKIEFMVASPRALSIALRAAEAARSERSADSFDSLKDCSSAYEPQISDEEDDFDPILESFQENEADADEGILGGVSPVVTFVSKLLAAGDAEGASEVVIEPDETGFRIRARLRSTGRWSEPKDCRFPRHLFRPVVGRIKVMALLDLAERRVPQHGTITWREGDRSIQAEVSCLPTVHGEEICLRFVGGSPHRIGYKDLPLAHEVREKLDETLAGSRGLVMVAGPIPEGAERTLEVLANHFSAADDKVVVVDDGPGIEVANASRIHVRNEIGLTAAQALRAALRHRPDVLVVVNASLDLETARLLFEAVERGALVFASMPVDTAPDALARLVHMGVEPYLVSTLSRAVLAQRHVRLLCPACKKESTSGLYPFVADGCTECGHSGYSGWHTVFDVLFPAEHIEQFTADSEPWWNLRGRSYEALREAALNLARQGRTSAVEALKRTATP